MDKEYYRKYAREHRKEQNAGRMRRHHGNKQRVQEYKLAHGCQICGYNKCAMALHFHHPKDNKTKNINSRSFVYLWSWPKILTEINKCIIICANCHAEICSKEINNAS